MTACATWKYFCCFTIISGFGKITVGQRHYAQYESPELSLRKRRRALYYCSIQERGKRVLWMPSSERIFCLGTRKNIMSENMRHALIFSREWLKSILSVSIEKAAFGSTCFSDVISEKPMMLSATLIINAYQRRASIRVTIFITFVKAPPSPGRRTCAHYLLH